VAIRLRMRAMVVLLWIRWLLTSPSVVTMRLTAVARLSPR
jgi:hypothetical protein